jgi:hypothetical protein
MKLWERAKIQLDSTVIGLRENKKGMLATISEADQTMMGDRTNGMLNVSVATIFEFARVKYGTPDQKDFTAARNQMLAPMGPNEQVEDVIARHMRAHDLYATNATALPEVDKIDNFVSATTHIPYMNAVISSYNTLFPAYVNRTFSALVAYVQVQAPNYASSAPSLGYAGAAHNITGHTFSEVPAQVHSAYGMLAPPPVYAFPAYGPPAPPPGYALPTYGYPAHAPGYAGAAHGTPQLPVYGSEEYLANMIQTAVTAALRSSKPKPKPKTDRKYCFVHGYDNHNSDQCNRMVNDTATYSTVQRAAKTHTNPSGGNKYRL